MIESASSAPTGHDFTNYAASVTGTQTSRGNPTTVTRKCLVVGCSDAITHAVFDETGQIVSVKDPRGNTTEISYADNYTTGDGQPTGNTNTYQTRAC